MKEIHYKNTKNPILLELLDKNDYYAMFTVLFNFGQKLPDSLTLTNKMLHNINRKLYGDNYKSKYQFVDGFAVVEKHLQFKYTKYHLHMLIKSDSKFDQHDIDKFLQLAISSSKKLKNDKNELAFVSYGVSGTINNDAVTGLATESMQIVKPYNKFATSYITKTIRNNNADKLILLSKDGLLRTNDQFHRY